MCVSPLRFSSGRDYFNLVNRALLCNRFVLIQVYGRSQASGRGVSVPVVQRQSRLRLHAILRLKTQLRPRRFCFWLRFHVPSDTGSDPHPGRAERPRSLCIIFLRSGSKV